MVASQLTQCQVSVSLAVSVPGCVTVRFRAADEGNAMKFRVGVSKVSNSYGLTKLRSHDGLGYKTVRAQVI